MIKYWHILVRKASKFTKCSICFDLLKNILIKGISHGNLLKPSTNVFVLIKLSESETLKVTATDKLSTDTIFKVLD